jgi:DNA-binding response OmpR family regulator
LYLEDNAQTREAMVYILEKEGFSLLSYASAEAASTHLAQGGVDLAIMDVGLPGRRGDDFAREFAEKHPHVRIYFLTAEAEIDSLKHLVPGCIVLHKPVDIEALLELLKCALAVEKEDGAGPETIPFPGRVA